MHNSLIGQYSDKEFAQIIKDNNTYSDVLKQMGYKCVSGKNIKKLKNRIDALNLNTNHFVCNKPSSIKRTPKNIFIENSTASQSTLRKYYLKENIPYICNICKQEPFWNGSPLTLILDHINGKNHDDRYENLRWVCPNCNQQLPTTNGKNKFHHYNYCLSCGKQIHKRSTYCKDCINKTNKSKRQQDIINKHNLKREKLKQEIRTLSFCEIGRLYEVSDNTVRKWCKIFNLPTKAIKNYSDEEWKDI